MKRVTNKLKWQLPKLTKKIGNSNPYPLHEYSTVKGLKLSLIQQMEEQQTQNYPSWTSLGDMQDPSE